MCICTGLCLLHIYIQFIDVQSIRIISVHMCTISVIIYFVSDLRPIAHTFKENLYFSF